MKVLLTLLRQSRLALVLAVVAGMASGFASTGLLAMVNLAVTRDEPPGEGFYLLFLALCGVVPASLILSSFLLQRLGQGTVMELRLRLARRILGTPLRQLERLGAARLLTVLTEDVSVLAATIFLIPAMAINGSVILGCLAYLGWLSPPLFLAFLAMLAFGVVTYRLPLVAGMRRMRVVREIQEALFEHFRGLTEGIKELKLHARRSAGFLDSLAGSADAQRREQIAANTILSSGVAWGQLLFFLVVGGLLVVRPRLAGVGSEEMMSYVVVIIYLLSPLQAVLNSLPQLGRADVSVGRIEELGLSLDPREETVARRPVSAAGWRELRLEGVTHRYRGESEDDRFTLGPLDLSFAPGELVIVAGGNGSGKTTLAKLLVGLYEPEGGRILLDGRPVGETGVEAYRQHFTAVFSDFFLFAELLGLDTPGLDERAEHYLRKLHLADKVAVRDGSLSTTSLSQGQRKRLALLTAYLEDRPIYVFDEWAADQDPVFKRIFYEALLPELKVRGKTVVAISHDDQYYGVADRLIKLDYGQVLHDGKAPRLAAAGV